MASSIPTGHFINLNAGTIIDRLFTSTISSSNFIDTSANSHYQDQQLNETFTSILNSSTNSSCILDQQLQNPLVIISVICMVIVNLVVIFGNVLVILSVFLYTKLRTVTNFFIVSLAVADLLLGVSVVPYSLTQTISKTWYFGKIWCLGWLVIDVWLSTASIMNLVAISYRTMMTAKRAKILIASAWILSFIICFPPLVSIGWNQKNSGLIQINLKQQNTLNPAFQTSHPSPSFSSTTLSLNQNSSNSFSQTTTELNSWSSVPSNSRIEEFIYNSDNSQRTRKRIDRYFNDELVVTSAPLIANSIYVNNILKDQLNRKRTKLKRELIAKRYNQAISSSQTESIKFNPQYKSKYKKLSEFKRWRRDLIKDDLISKNKSNLDCDYQVLQCVLFDSKGYVIYSAVGSFFIPMFIMIFFYWRIYLVASYTTKALNRGYISKKSIRANPLSMLTGTKGELSASTILQKSNASSAQFNNLDSASDMMSSNLTLRVHRGYIKDQSQPTQQLNLANDLNRRSTNRSSYDSTGRQSSTSTTITVRANSTVDTTTAAQLCRRLLPTRLSNRILSNNDAKQLRKIQHRSVRCLDRTQNIITLAADASKPKAAALKHTQSEQCIELNSSKGADLNKNTDKIDNNLDQKDDKNSEKIEDKKDESADKIANKVTDKESDKDDLKKMKNGQGIRISNSEKNIASKLQLVKQYSLSSNNLMNGKDQRKFTFNLKKDANLQTNASQIQLNIEPPQEDRTNSVKSSENDHLIPKVDENDNQTSQQNGYQTEINNNLPKSDLIEHLDSSIQLNNNLAHPQTAYLTTSGSTKSKYFSYWSRLSKKRTNLNKNPNQNTNSSGKFQAKRFLAETKAAKTVGIIVGCFWCCWFPFFTVYLIRGLCEDKNCISDVLLTSFTWLGYINSGLNPIIYGMFSKDFRRAFKNIICKCKFSEDTGISTLIKQIHLPNLFEEDMI